MEIELPRPWTNDETKLLIKTRLNYESIFAEGKTKKSILWDEVLEEIIKVNESFPYDRMEINKKFLNLMITYKRIIKRNIENGKNSSTWEYFDDFDNVYKWNQMMIKVEPQQEYLTEQLHFEEYSVDEQIEETTEFQPKRKRKNREILDFLAKEAEESERRHQELLEIEREKIEIERKRLKLLSSLVNVLQNFVN